MHVNNETELVFIGQDTPYSVWERIHFCLVRAQAVVPLLRQAFNMYYVSLDRYFLLLLW